MKQKIKSKYIYMVISFLFVLSIDHYFFGENTLGVESIFNFLLLLCIYKLQMFATDIESRTKKYGFLYGFILSCVLSLGRVLYDTNRISNLFYPIQNFFFFIISVISFTMVLGSAIAIVFKYLSSEKYLINNHVTVRKSDTLMSRLQHPHIFFLIWLFIFLSWIPAFLAYYPGIFSYDMLSQTQQALNLEPYTRFHPPLHTFIWALCLKLGSNTGIESISIYGLSQMLLLSLALTKMITLLIKKGMKKQLIILSLLFVSINPVIAIFSFIPTKDAYFAVLFTLTIISLFDIIPWLGRNILISPRKWIPFVLYSSFACLFRNNAVYIFILFLFIILFFFPKYPKRNFIIFVLPILVFIIINGPIYNHLKILPGNSREMLSVPMQQIADVVTYDSDSLSEEIKQEINIYLPYDKIAERYNPRFADPIKKKFNTEAYEQDPVRFYKLWFKLLFSHPGNYASAFLSLNLPYWYPDACSIDVFSERAYLETNIRKCDSYSFERQSKLPNLLSYYEKVASYDAFKNIPLVSNLFSISTPIWVLISCLFVILLKKEREGIIILAPQLLFWLTYLAGPVSNFRYIFPLFILYPISFALIFDPHSMLKKAENETV